MSDWELNEERRRRAAEREARRAQRSGGAASEPSGPRHSQGRRRAASGSEIAHRRRAALGLIALLALVVGVVAGARSGGEDLSPSEAVDELAEAPPELPRGGRTLLPDFRLVGYYGAPQSDELGALGIGTPAEASAALERQAAKYEGDRPVLPFLELIAAVANADPGEDGLYRTRQGPKVIDTYLEQARADRSLLVLDIQPGHADFPDEIRPLRRWLREPDVGLALDPEWHVGDGEVPGQVIGSVDAADVNDVAARLSDLVVRNDLPEKLLIVHQFTADMIVDKERLEPHPGVALVLNVDGFGDPPNKVSKYDQLRAPKRSGLFTGFKLFYKEDLDLMSPRDVLGLKPKPDLVLYE